MAVGLRSGSIVTVIVGGEDLLNPLGAALSDRVSSALLAQGARLRVRRFTENERNVTGPTTVLYRATVLAETTIDRANADEVAAVVVFAFYLATGYQPSEYGVADVAEPGTTNPLPDRPDGIPRIPVISDVIDALSAMVKATPILAVGLIIVAAVIVFMFSQRVTKIGKVAAR